MLEIEQMPVPTPAGIQIFREILQHGPLSRAEIARNTGLSQPAVTKVTTPLISAHFIEEGGDQPDGQAPAQVGRPIIPVRVNPNKCGIIGIKVTENLVYGVVINFLGEMFSAFHEQLIHDDEDSVVSVISKVCKKLATATKLPVAGIGVGISGEVDTATGVVRESPLLGWHQPVSLQALLEATCGLPVVIKNDVAALTVAEQLFGVGTSASSFAVVTIGAGVGCGLFVNGGVVSGAHDVAGEIGHLPLAPGNLLCSCGRRSCVETVASYPAILRSIRASKNKPQLSFDEAVSLAQQGDAQACEAFTLAGETIGKALASMVNLIGPEKIIVAGEGVENYGLLGTQILESFEEHAFGASAETHITIRSHTFDDWARGAGVCVIMKMACLS